MPIRAWAAPAAGKPLAPFEYEPAPLGPNDVEIAVSHCGICHSDLHLVDNDWGISVYPLVPGHEIVGEVRALGPAVTHLAVGQRVGVGWQRGACLVCEWCLRGEENLCPHNQATCVGHPGGYAEAIRLDARFAFPIPQALASRNAGPLLCGGATVYSPLRRRGVRPEMKVGVIGIGGLGHMALQFARAMGCEVTAFSSTPEKADEARGFGAQRFVVTRDPKALAAERGRHDFILSTLFAPLDWAAYVQALRPNGKLIFVGVPSAPIDLPPGLLLGGQKSIGGSAIGSRHVIAEMLEFAARHKIEAQTETLPMRDVNAAFARLRANKARYRIVLEN